MERQGLLVLLEYAVGADVDYPPIAISEGIADHPAVASPPLALRAHDRGAALAGQQLQALESGGELGRLHVVGIAAKRSLAPRARPTARAWLAPPTELIAEGLVGDAYGAERVAQGGCIE